jgi:dTDP-4-dehydrorhamnose reductase
MKVCVIGGNGQLGTDVTQAFQARGDEVVGLTHADIQIESMDSVKAVMQRIRPDIVVNTAAMHHVEKCEADPERAFAINGLGSRNLALAANDSDTVLVHISTDYVFDGSKKEPWVETDAPSPLNVYGNTKLSGENFVKAIARRHFVVRVSALFGKSPCRAKGGQNFVDLMLRLGRERGKVRVVDSEFVSPTNTRILSQQIVALAGTPHYGLFHATAEGFCSWYEFAKEIFERAGIPCDVQAAGPDEFPAKVPRPKFSVLENNRLKNLGLNLMTDWREGLRQYLA